MKKEQITAISVFIEVDGKLYCAPIDHECALMFLGMLPAFQKNAENGARLVVMPPDVSQHVYAAGKAISEHQEKKASS